jgi:hypothetical protein
VAIRASIAATAYSYRLRRWAQYSAWVAGSPPCSPQNARDYDLALADLRGVEVALQPRAARMMREAFSGEVVNACSVARF